MELLIETLGQDCIIHLETFQDPRGKSLPRLGAVWDSFPELALDYLDDRDPPRTRYESMEEGLREFSTSVTAGSATSTSMYRYAIRDSTRSSIEVYCAPHVYCEWSRRELKQPADGLVELVYPQKASKWGVIFHPQILRDAGFGPVYEWLKDFAVTSEAYFAIVWLVPMRKQFRAYGSPAVVLTDVGWINLYGPALIEHWGGPGCLDGLGVFQETLANGAVVVWATEQPQMPDPAAKSRAWYPWKHPFYRRLGRDTFDSVKLKNQPFEELWEMVGVHLPTVEAQRRHAWQYGDPR